MQINRARFLNLGRPQGLREEDFLLTPEQVEILEEQIRKNTDRIGEFVAALDRLVNLEGFSANHPRVERIRARMELLMDENNTFRQNLWRYWLLIDNSAVPGTFGAWH